MYTDKLWTAVSARGGLRRMRAFIVEANFSSKAGGSLLQQQQEQRGNEGEGSQTPQSLHAAITATHGHCLHYGTGNTGNSSGEANSSYCPQIGSPEGEMALSQCQPSLPSPLGLLPCSSSESAAPQLCHPCEGASPDPSNRQLWTPGHHSPSSLQSPLCQGQALSPSPASFLCQPRGTGWEGMSTVPQPSTFGVRRRKRTKNPSNHAQPWAWHTILTWDRPQLPETVNVGRKEF